MQIDTIITDNNNNGNQESSLDYDLSGTLTWLRDNPKYTPSIAHG